jgi:hypothetical protein
MVPAGTRTSEGPRRPRPKGDTAYLAPFVYNVPNIVFEQLLRVRSSASAEGAISPLVLVYEGNQSRLVVSVGHDLAARAWRLPEPPTLDVFIFLYRLVEALAGLDTLPVLPIVEHLS